MSEPQPTPAADATGERPLDGLVVLDLSRLLPGGYATMIMADLGADVIKVEQPGRGDYIRFSPPYTSTGHSAAHEALNRGKRSITLDLKQPGGRDVLLDLVRGADVLVESFRPGVMDRLGVGHEALAEVNPRLVYVAISGYGADGPYRDRAGHDIDYLAYSGGLSFTGGHDGEPSQPGLQIGDLGGGGLMAVVAALSALRVREQTGRGQLCDVSMTDGAFSWLSIHAGDFAATGRAPQVGREPLNGGLACYGTYRCADDRWLAVGALEPQFFAVLAEAVGLDEQERGWHVDPARQDDLRARLAEVFATRPRDEWAALLEPLDACVAPVLDVAEAFDDPQLRARGMVVDDVLDDGTPFRRVGVVPRLEDTPGRPGRSPSALGADTDDVLRAAGRSESDVAALREAGVV